MTENERISDGSYNDEWRRIEADLIGIVNDIINTKAQRLTRYDQPVGNTGLRNTVCCCRSIADDIYRILKRFEDCI